jgi:hypothetical protein
MVPVLTVAGLITFDIFRVDLLFPRTSLVTAGHEVDEGSIAQTGVSQSDHGCIHGP